MESVGAGRVVLILLPWDHELHDSVMAVNFSKPLVLGIKSRLISRYQFYSEIVKIKY